MIFVRSLFVIAFALLIFAAPVQAQESLELPACPDGVAEQFNEQASYLTAAVPSSSVPYAMAEDAIAVRRLFWNEIVPTYPPCREVVIAALVQGRLLDEWVTLQFADAAGQDNLVTAAQAEIARLNDEIDHLGSASLDDFIGTNVTSIDDRPFMTPDEVLAVLNPVDETAPATVLPTGETFDVVVNGNVNLRACAGTQCSTVGTAQNGSLLTVLGSEHASDGDWYQVQRDDGSTAFIASWLTMRGPDIVIRTDEAYTDVATSCAVAFDIKRGDQDLNVILTGEGMGDVIVDVFKPNQSQPVRVDAQLDKTFIDTGDPYIHQVYGWGEYWPTGVYQLEITRDGESTRLAWELEQPGDYNIFVYCG